MSDRKYAGIDEMTGERAGWAAIGAETWGGKPLVLVMVARGDLPQEQKSVYLRTPVAGYMGAALLRMSTGAPPDAKGYAAIVVPALEEYLRANGWEPADPAGEAVQEGDWTPPEDRGNPWDFDRAVEEQRKRERRAARDGVG
jgi:hypothetical protein